MATMSLSEDIHWKSSSLSGREIQTSAAYCFCIKIKFGIFSKKNNELKINANTENHVRKLNNTIMQTQKTTDLLVK